MVKDKNSRAEHENLWRYFEWVFWPALLFGFSLLTATADYLRDTRSGGDVEFWVPLSRELISSAWILILVPGIVYLVRRFSWRRIGVIPFFGLHLLATLPFTVIHVVGTITVRMSGPLIEGASLNWDYILGNLKFEYPKDLIVYVLIVVIINIYTWVRRSIGDADRVSLGAETIPVKTFSGVVLVRIGDIEWIEAARNYVVLHAGGKEYFLRTPIKDIEKDFAAHSFVRIHRSAIVNLSKVMEIKKAPPRDEVAVLATGKKINVGRQYREALNKALGLKN